MGHIEYFQAYEKQPYLFRDGANPGFHEAIGDTMALSVATPCHLKALGLIDNCESTEKQDLNFLMLMALRKICFLPFALIMDLARWRMFDGQIPMDKLESGWWDLRIRYQGVSPPSCRNEHGMTNNPKLID